MNTHPRVVTIRPKVYRGQEGFRVSGWQRESFWRPAVFTHTRSSAERIKARMKAGLDVRLEDFQA